MFSCFLHASELEHSKNISHYSYSKSFIKALYKARLEKKGLFYYTVSQKSIHNFSYIYSAYMQSLHIDSCTCTFLHDAILPAYNRIPCLNHLLGSESYCAFSGRRCCRSVLNREYKSSSEGGRGQTNDWQQQRQHCSHRPCSCTDGSPLICRRE